MAIEDAPFGKCVTCGMDVTRRTTYQFPEEFGQKALGYVFCSYDCMTSWIYRNMRKEVYVREGEVQTVIGVRSEEIDVEDTTKKGEWF